MIKPPVKILGIAALVILFLALIWANRTGKFERHAYHDGGTLVEVADDTPWPPKTISVTLGTYVQKIYDFQVQSQTFAAEGWVWLVWPQEFQDILVSKEIPVSEILEIMNLERTTDFGVTPTTTGPTKLPDGRWCLIYEFYGRFNADGLNFRRFPFETIHFPLTFGLNPENTALDAANVRLVPDTTRFGLGEYTNVPGYVLTGKKLTEFIYQRRNPVGLPADTEVTETRFSRIQMKVSYGTSTIAAFLQLFLPLSVVMAVVLLAPNLAGSLWDVRIALPSTALLTLIFLQQGYRSQLPALPYLTFIDQVYTLSYATALVIFCLFVWSSNRLDQAPHGEREAVIQHINKVDLRFQIGLTIALAILITLSWFFPGG